ncbi:MAG: TldD/PmbA family protein, partial [Thermacetogeniaceae bacterium]
MDRLEKADICKIVEAAVEGARVLGAEQAEAFFSQSDELVIEVRNGEVENLKLARESGIGIRVINGGRLGFAYTSDIGRDSIQEAVEQALANSRTGSTDPYHSLPDPTNSYPEMELVDHRLREVPLEDKIKLALEIEKSGRGYDRKVRLTEEACYQEEHYQIVLANSHGILASSEGSWCGGYASMVAGDDGDQQTGFGLCFTRRFDELDPEAIGREAAFKAVRMLGARRLETGRVPVVFDPYV